MMKGDGPVGRWTSARRKGAADGPASVVKQARDDLTPERLGRSIIWDSENGRRP